MYKGFQIIGIGSDLVDVRRIEGAMARHGQRFIQRIFTEKEQTYANKQHKPALTYAKRFAAKEAAAKATGRGISQLLSWKDIEITTNEKGQPILMLSKSSQQALYREIEILRSWVSLSDEYPYAQAFVVLGY